VGADSAETRARILRAAREVINERGYEAANFQAIASRAGLSRPTMHYYFHTREEIYDCLVAEAYSVVADCTFVAAAYRSGFADRSMMRFTITARLESHRSPSLRENPGPVVPAVQAFYALMVEEAMARGEIPADTDADAVVNMLLAMFLGMGFFAGFIADRNDMTVIAKQLHQLMTHGLLDQPQAGPSLTIAPPVPVAVSVDDFAEPWPGLTG
jgi:AcrR family transcriptional regulator